MHLVDRQAATKGLADPQQAVRRRFTQNGLNGANAGLPLVEAGQGHRVQAIESGFHRPQRFL